jgi:hypothetical protein
MTATLGIIIGIVIGVGIGAAIAVYITKPRNEAAAAAFAEEMAQRKQAVEQEAEGIL